MRCLEDGCEASVRWLRVTQFAGEHSFCDLHARAEKDFGQTDNSYFFWKELNVKVSHS